MTPEEQELERSKLRMQYSWQWFQLHANQRTTLFNYFLVISGVLATALATCIKDKLWALGTGVSGLGILSAIAFTRLDQRNRSLIGRGEDLLRWLELEVLNLSVVDNGAPGILLRDQHFVDDHRMWFVRVLSKHRIWIRSLEVYVGSLFAIMLLYTVNGCRDEANIKSNAGTKALPAKNSSIVKANRMQGEQKKLGRKPSSGLRRSGATDTQRAELKK